MMKNISILAILLTISSFIFADEEVKKQIESLMLQQSINDNSKVRFTEQPNGLEEVTIWKYEGQEVIPTVIENSGNVTVTIFHSEASRNYWYRVQGTVLNIDIWYGAYSYQNYEYRNDRGFFSQNFAAKHCRDIPQNSPSGLTSEVQYRTKDFGNIVLKNSHGVVYPGYEAFSYYCDKGQRYWVELIDLKTSSSTWYGPYPYVAPQPQVRLSVSVELDQKSYRVGEAPVVEVWVHNNSSRNVWLEFSSGLRGDYRIDNYYQWSSGKMSIQMLGREQIPAFGKKRLLRKAHSLREFALSKGKHSIVGIVKTMNHGTLQSKEKKFKVKKGSGYNPPNLPSNQLMSLAVEFIKKRQYNKARIVLKRVLEMEPNSRIAHYNLACVESLSYNEDVALDHFEKALAFGYRDFLHIRQDNDLNNIRYLPRFRQILRKYRNY